MRQRIGLVTVVVQTYDAALAFYVGVLGFDLIEDTPLGAGRRWVVVRPRGAGETGLLLAEADGASQRDVVGRQTGGRVFLFLVTDDFERDHAAYLARGVRFRESPRQESYGRVVVFEDGCGNLWDLIEPARPQSGVQAP